MRTFIAIVFILLTFRSYSQTPPEKAETLREQAQTSLKQKKYTEARYLFLKAYEAYTLAENYPKAIESAIQTDALYLREGFYKEAFDLCRAMDQLIRMGEQKQQKSFYDLRSLVTKERLKMYTMLKKHMEAKMQLDKLEESVNLAKNDSLSHDLLYTKTNYYYTFGLTAQGDAAFEKLIEAYKGNKDYEKVGNAYREIIDIARKANNAPLTARTYENYMAWKDSVKTISEKNELNVLKRNFDEAQQVITDKDGKLATKQYLIIGLLIVAAALVGALLVLSAIFLRLTVGNRKLKRSIQTANEHNELKTKFIRNISLQMEPTLNALDATAHEITDKAPRQAAQMSAQVGALKGFSNHIQELSALENSLTETYGMEDINAGALCKSLMERIKSQVKEGVETSVNAPKLQIKTNKEQLERILTHLLINAAYHTPAGHIRLEFKKRGARTHQFIITDTGAGIPSEKKENLFKPFAEVRDLTQGDGLGLPICALIAAKMNGNLTLETTYTKGSRFVLELHG